MAISAKAIFANGISSPALSQRRATEGTSARRKITAPATIHAPTGRSQRNSETRDCPARNAPKKSEKTAITTQTNETATGSFGRAGPASPNVAATDHAIQSPNTISTNARSEKTDGAYFA